MASGELREVLQVHSVDHSDFHRKRAHDRVHPVQKKKAQKEGLVHIRCMIATNFLRENRHVRFFYGPLDHQGFFLGSRDNKKVLLLEHFEENKNLPCEFMRYKIFVF